MRNNLVMQFCCSECGNILNIRTKSDEKVKNIRTIEDRPILPTGAELRFIEPIQIDPCVSCIEKYTRPSKELIKALDSIINIKI